MACKLSANYNLIFVILSCNLLEDNTDVDLKVHTLWGIHTYKKDRGTQVIKCSPWGTEVKPFLSLQKKMAEFLSHRKIITTPFASRSFQTRSNPNSHEKVQPGNSYQAQQREVLSTQEK